MSPVHAPPLAGRRILVTGAGRGLGRAIAVAVADAGAHAILVARSADQLADAAERIRAAGGSAEFRAVDLSEPDAVAALAGALAAVDGPGLDGVVHAAGIQHRADAVDFPADAFRRVLAVNLEAPFALSQALARHGGGRAPASHVFIGSLASSIAIPRAVAYAASKAGLLGVVRTLANEWAPAGVRVNAISPGYFRTELTDDLLGNPAQLARVTARIPMGRLGDPAELGGAAVFLLSDMSAYVTGQQIVVDGGWLSS